MQCLYRSLKILCLTGTTERVHEIFVQDQRKQMQRNVKQHMAFCEWQICRSEETDWARAQNALNQAKKCKLSIG